MYQQDANDAYHGFGGVGGVGGSHILPWTYNSFNPTHFSTREYDPFLLSTPPPPPPPPPHYDGFFNKGFSGLESDHLIHPSSDYFGLQQKLSCQEIVDAKALAASKSHSEAERRRRERINNHLAKLRSLLPSNTKTDKASLLAEVVHHVKELKRQTSVISDTTPFPTEINELTLENASDEDGKLLIKASICCDDRCDLFSDIIDTLKSLRLRVLKAEITTLEGRVKNVLFIAGEEDNDLNSGNGDDREEQEQYSISSIREALKAVMEKSSGDGSGSGSYKRQRTNVSILENRSF